VVIAPWKEASQSLLRCALIVSANWLLQTSGCPPSERAGTAVFWWYSGVVGLAKVGLEMDYHFHQVIILVVSTEV
jgi:hypothetical protein